MQCKYRFIQVTVDQLGRNIRVILSYDRLLMNTDLKWFHQETKYKFCHHFCVVLQMNDLGRERIERNQRYERRTHQKD